jgi:hypothetical protein
MKLATRLFGSAAGLCATAGAQAADLPVQKAASVEYVRVCTAVGEGFFYIPGTDTCLRIGGQVRAERIAIETFDRRDDAIGFLARGRLNVDARTSTEYGTLRAFFRYELTRSTGAYFDSGSALNGVGDPGQSRTGPNLDHAFVQFGPLTAGRLQSFFDFYADDLLFSAQLGSDLVTQTLAYTATFGDVSATIAIEDGIERRVFNGPTDFGVFRLVGGEPEGILFPGLTTRSGTFFPQSFAVGGETAPDVVGALGLTQSWGSAQLSGAVHQVRSANFQPFLGQAVPANFRGTDVVDTEYGFAVQGGVKINLPLIAAGDVLWLQAAYANGAINYLGFGTDTSVRNRGPFVLNQSDAFVNAVGDVELTEGSAVVGAFSHYFTPQIRGELMASYGRLDYDRSATGVVTSASAFGVANRRLIGSRFGFLDTREYRLEASAIWSPAKDLDIGVDVLYQNIDPKGRVIGVESGAGGTLLRSFDDQDIVIGRMRVQRDF